MDTNLIIDALQRCADMDSAMARGYRIDAENCELSHSEVIRDRAELLRFRAEKLEEKAAEYRRVILSQNLMPLEMIEIKVAMCRDIIAHLAAWFEGATLDPIRLKGMVATVQSESSQNI